jgi:hypothetical protein
MDRDDMMVGRRMMLAGAFSAAGLAVMPAALAKTTAGGFKGLIGNASDGALDRLAQPGAFYADAAVRILLPGASGKLASKKDGATRYLQSSAGGVLNEKVRPLIAGALDDVGAYRQLDQLASNSQLLSVAGISRDRLTDSVTEQALKGIFLYMGNEEAALRKNPGKLLKGIF